MLEPEKLPEPTHEWPTGPRWETPLGWVMVENGMVVHDCDLTASGDEARAHARALMAAAAIATNAVATPEDDGARMHVVEWAHPVHGRMAEVVCREHETGLLGALGMLDIGCLGSNAAADGVCARCRAEGGGSDV